MSVKIATIGERSSGPSGGRNAPEDAQVRVADVVEEPLHPSRSAYGSRIHDVRM